MHTVSRYDHSLCEMTGDTATKWLSAVSSALWSDNKTTGTKSLSAMIAEEKVKPKKKANIYLANSRLA